MKKCAVFYGFQIRRRPSSLFSQICFYGLQQFLRPCGLRKKQETLRVDYVERLNLCTSYEVRVVSAGLFQECKPVDG